MSKLKTFLFISIDGMTDPLGQSQVLPYLIGLSQKGFKIKIVSCEKKENWDQHHLNIDSIIKNAGIYWDYCFYKTEKPFLSQFQNYLALKKLAASTVDSNTVLHCRSYLAGLIGLYCKKKFNSGFIFDMRGFWADERIEGEIWSKKNPITTLLYSFFKKKEKELLQKSDAIISLTQKAKDIILSWNLGITNNKISVIPCCVDLEHFSTKSLDESKLIAIKQKYPQLQNKFVLIYVGSLGTWYMANEMLDFYNHLRKQIDSHFLMITKDSPLIIENYIKNFQIPKEEITITPSSRADMPYFITLSDASIFFIKPSFSKSASSPTKMGELLSMEVPIITNSGIGDVDDIINQSNCGLSISQFNSQAYQDAIHHFVENRILFKKNTKQTAHDFFSLKEGIEQYNRIYKSFLRL